MNKDYAAGNWRLAAGKRRLAEDGRVKAEG
jgi:hypothetical protein